MVRARKVCGVCEEDVRCVRGRCVVCVRKVECEYMKVLYN